MQINENSSNTETSSGGDLLGLNKETFTQDAFADIPILDEVLQDDLSFVSTTDIQNLLFTEDEDMSLEIIADPVMNNGSPLNLNDMRLMGVENDLAYSDSNGFNDIIANSFIF